MNNPEIGDPIVLLSQYYQQSDQMYNQFVQPEQVVAPNTKPRRRRKKKNDGEGGDVAGMMMMRNKRKLSEEQAKMLEKSFGSEQKLESDRKERLAAEVGLDPRQVAVWFQNRRARWRSKKLEEEYDSLKSKHHVTVLEKCQLETELLKVKEQLHEAEKEVQRLSERFDGFSSNSPMSSSFSMEAMEPLFLGEFGMDGSANMFCEPDQNNTYAHGLEWDNNLYYNMY